MVQQVKLQFGAPAPLFRVPGTGLCLCLCSHPSCLLRQPGRWQMVAQVLGPLSPARIELQAPGFSLTQAWIWQTSGK